MSWRRALDDLLAVDTIAVTASSRLGDRHREGGALNNLGVALTEVQRFDARVGLQRCEGAVRSEM